MCQLCQQLGLDLHKVTVLQADSGGPSEAGAANAAMPDGGSGPDGQNPGFDTVPGSTATTFSMSSGTSVRGYVNSAGEQDWYSINLVAGQTYTFTLSGIGTGALSDAYLRLLNSVGTEIAFDDDSGPLNNSKLTFTASTSGTYYVSAGGWGTTTGQYLLTMNNGATPYTPVVSISDVADYLTNTYWEVNNTIAHHWGTMSVTYNVQALEPERAVLARLAFQLWSEVANLTFVETTGAAQIILDDTQSGAFASSNYNGSGIITSANINVINTWFGGSDAVDSYTLQTFIHEIGHSIGLGHGGPYNGSATYGVDNTYANDTWQLSLMSYMSQDDYGSGSFRFTMTPMMADILAVQRLYGAAATRTGDTVYGHGSTAGFLYDFSFYSQAPALTIYDSGGTDTLNASGYGNNQTINLAGGSFSNIGGLIGNIGIYTSSVIENAVGGSGSDVITGNAVANVLIGNGGNDTLSGLAGDDTLNGGTGIDTMSGGTGNDTYSVDNAGDVVVENSGEGTDTVNATVSYTLPSNFETLVLVEGAVGAVSAAGNGALNWLYGNSASNTLFSYGGDDVLLGGGGNDIIDGGIGNDAMAGGTGDDTYYVDSAADSIFENNNEGIDTVYATINYTLSNNFETLFLVEGAAGAVSAAGNGVQNFLYGNSGNNTLFSYVGDDVLVGGGGNDIIDGGVGDDTMAGGTGNDTYYVDSQADTIMENAGEGSDTVFSTASFTLANEFEILFLIEGAAAAINGAGNSVANQIYGNSLGNALSGYGGADILVGGAGNDIINGGSGVDLMHGGDDDDIFIFAAGEANGDEVLDFTGNGAAAGDSFQFTGFGTAAQGATFTHIGITNDWQIHSGLDSHNEIITLSNAVSVHTSDYIFV